MKIPIPLLPNSKTLALKAPKKPKRRIGVPAGLWVTKARPAHYPGTHPTNNLAEQAVREHVIVKRIIGTFRSKSGPREYQYLAFLPATWKLQNKNMFEELENLIQNEPCLKIT